MSEMSLVHILERSPVGIDMSVMRRTSSDTLEFPDCTLLCCLPISCL